MARAVRMTSVAALVAACLVPVSSRAEPPRALAGPCPVAFDVRSLAGAVPWGLPWCAGSGVPGALTPSSSPQTLAPCVEMPAFDDRCERWTAIYDGPDGYSGGGADGATGAVTSADGKTVYVSGTGFDDATDFDGLTFAYDAVTGARLWSDRFDDGGAIDIATALAISPDSATLYVTGIHGERISGGQFTGGDAMVIAYDAATGARRWTSSYASNDGAIDAGAKIVVAPDGKHIYVGGITGSGGGRDFLVIAFDAATGSRDWVARYDGPRHYSDQFQGFAMSPSGDRVYVSGFTEPGAGFGPFDSMCDVVAFDTSNGAVAWEDHLNDAPFFDGAPGGFDLCAGVAASPDGASVYVTGSQERPGAGNYWANADLITMAFDASTGARRWIARDPGHSAGQNYGFAVVAAPEGVYATGLSMGDATDYDWDYATFAYNAGGSVRWSARYAPPGQDLAAGTALALGGSRLYVTGFTCAGPSVPYRLIVCAPATLAYSTSDGTQQWVARFDTGDAILPSSIAVSADGAYVSAGSVYLFDAQSYGANGGDMFLFAYDA